MLGYIIVGLYILCTVLSALSGRAGEAGAAVMQGAESAVSFALSIAGGICLWSAVLEVMERCGISASLARLLTPVLRRMFPRAASDPETLSALAENVGANILGLGNAATPAGIRAAKGIARLGDDRGARDELCLLVVLNTASIQLLPTTIASVRAAKGAASAFDILPAVWISSAISVSAGLLMSVWLRKLWK